MRQIVREVCLDCVPALNARHLSSSLRFALCLLFPSLSHFSSLHRCPQSGRCKVSMENEKNNTESHGNQHVLMNVWPRQRILSCARMPVREFQFLTHSIKTWFSGKPEAFAKCTFQCANVCIYFAAVRSLQPSACVCVTYSKRFSNNRIFGGYILKQYFVDHTRTHAKTRTNTRHRTQTHSCKHVRMTFNLKTFQMVWKCELQLQLQSQRHWNDYNLQCTFGSHIDSCTHTHTRAPLVRNLDDGARTVVVRLVCSTLCWKWCKREMVWMSSFIFFPVRCSLVWWNKYQGLRRPLWTFRKQ